MNEERYESLAEYVGTEVGEREKRCPGKNRALERSAIWAVVGCLLSVVSAGLFLELGFGDAGASLKLTPDQMVEAAVVIPIVGVVLGANLAVRALLRKRLWPFLAGLAAAVFCGIAALVPVVALVAVSGIIHAS